MINPYLAFDNRVLGLEPNSQLHFFRAVCFAVMNHRNGIHKSQLRMLRADIYELGDDRHCCDWHTEDADKSARQMEAAGLLVTNEIGDEVYYAFGEDIIWEDEQPREERPNLNLWPEAVEAGR